MKPARIGLDVMGGDHAPHEIVRGAAAGLGFLAPEDQLHLFGPRAVVEAECAKAGLTDSRVSIVHCSEVIDMDESPTDGVRGKPDSTIVRMASAAGKGEVDAIISAGNTGAFAASCQLKIRRIPGVSRPGIAVVMPTFHGPVVICDVGANVQPKPHHLYEYAKMSKVYAQQLLKIENPKVGIVSIGEEQGKGNPLVKEAHALLKDDPALTFIGNVEGRDIFSGAGNVFVCDGFVGNVVLKLTEGLAEGLFKTIVREIQQEGPQLAQAFQPAVDRIWKKHDFAEYGGAPLLGVNSVAIICHGRSDHRAIANAIRAARHEITSDLNAIIARSLEGHAPAAGAAS